MDGFIVFNGTTAQAADDMTAEFLRRHTGEVLTVKFLTGKTARDLTRHNQFFAILSRAVENMDYDITSNYDREKAVDDLLLKLKYACGFTEDRTKLSGEEIVIPKSIAFGDCAEQDAEQFRTTAYNVLCQILGCSRAELFGAV